MTLRRVWGCPSGAMCFRGTRTRARRTICGALPAFRVANSASTQRASVFMCASLIDFCASRKISSRTRLWNTALAAQLYSVPLLDHKRDLAHRSSLGAAALQRARLAAAA